MNPDDLVAPCLTDPRDRILLSQAPMLPMPQFGELAPPPLGRRQYVAASDGLYVRARHHGLSITARLSEVALPFGPLETAIHLPGGLVPFELYDAMERAAIAACPVEWAGVVHWDELHERYGLVIPRVISRSQGDITYATDEIDFERVVLIVHSHGLLPPFFSPTDDESDSAGVYFASVLGECRDSRTIHARTRLVIEGHKTPDLRPPWVTRAEHALAETIDEATLSDPLFWRPSAHETHLPLTRSLADAADQDPALGRWRYRG